MDFTPFPFRMIRFRFLSSVFLRLTLIVTLLADGGFVIDTSEGDGLAVSFSTAKVS